MNRCCPRKILLHSLIVVGTLSSTSATHAAAIAHWTFDQDPPTDSTSLTGHHGELVGGALISADGDAVAGEALVLNGEGQYMETNDASKDFQLSSGTVSLWFRGGDFKTNVGTVSLVDFHHGLHGIPDPTTHGWTIQPLLTNGSSAEGEITFVGFVNSNGGTAAVFTESGNALMNDGAFHHVAATFELGGDMTLYVDGVRRHSTTFPQGFVYDGAEKITIGHVGSGMFPDRDFAGRIDDVQIYDNALSCDEVRFLFNNPGLTVSGPVPTSAQCSEVPTVSGWGMVLMTMLMLTVGTLLSLRGHHGRTIIVE